MAETVPRPGCSFVCPAKPWGDICTYCAGDAKQPETLASQTHPLRSFLAAF